MADPRIEVYDQLRRRAVEDATLLWSLIEVPAVPRESALAPRASAWKLPPNREKQLADDFAFIVCSRDDPNEVKAVCVEEHQDGKGITVRMAANTGDLSRTVQELQTIANVLVEARHRGMGNLLILWLWR